MYYICIICVFAGVCWLFLGFLRPRRFLYVLLLAFAGFSWVFGVRGDFCMCFCWLFLGFWRPRRFLCVLLLVFLGLLESAAIFVCAFAGFCWIGWASHVRTRAWPSSHAHAKLVTNLCPGKVRVANLARQDLRNGTITPKFEVPTDHYIKFIG